MSKRKLHKPQRTQQEEVTNKKAIYWIGGVFVAIVIIVSLLLAFDV